MKKNNDMLEIDLVFLGKAIWHRMWLVLIITILCGAIGFALATYFVPAKYQSSVMIYVNNSSAAETQATTINASELNVARSIVDTYLVILNTRTTLEDVIAEAGVNYTYEELSKMITAAAVNKTEMFSVTVKSKDPYEAQRIADTIAAVLPDKIAGVVDGSDVRVADMATVQLKPVSPKVEQYALIGAAIGLVIVCAILVIIALLDKKVHSSDYLIETFDYPVLAEIPELIAANKSKAYAYKA